MNCTKKVIFLWCGKVGGRGGGGGGGGFWCSGTVYLRVGAGRDCGRGGWGPSRYYWLCWSIVWGKYPGWRGEGHRWFLQLCSLSAGGSCGLLHYSFCTRQWCSWSACSQWFPCRKWWGWVEGDLLFSAGGESVGTVVTWQSDMLLVVHKKGGKPHIRREKGAKPHIRYTEAFATLKMCMFATDSPGTSHTRHFSRIVLQPLIYRPI